MNIITNLLFILGSLGVFLFGMKILSQGIQQAAGDRMRKIMATMTHNRLLGIGTGFLTTCILQSSSATTVIVVSFVSAGLLTLIEAIGVIMGANLGTTVTAWIIAFVGKFSLASIALPIVGIGTPLIFIGKGKWKSFGEILIGFGLLFFGLGLLKDSVPNVKELLKSTDPEIVANTKYWESLIKDWAGNGYISILLFLIGGIVLTVLVQSSSAAMAITITLALNGWIGFEESCAIVLGENIGTTITAYLASIGANVEAKRAARAHLVFNVLGVLWMLIAFYGFTDLVQWLGDSLPDDFKTDKHNIEGDALGVAFNLAIFHTLFNLINICLLFAFVPLIAKIVTKWVREDSSNDQQLTYLSQPIFENGEVNMPVAEKALSQLADYTIKIFENYKDISKADQNDYSTLLIKSGEIESQIDQLTKQINDHLTKLTTTSLTQESATKAINIIRVSSELEEASDAAYQLIKLSPIGHDDSYDFDEFLQTRLNQIISLTEKSLNLTKTNLLGPIEKNLINNATKYRNSIVSIIIEMDQYLLKGEKEKDFQNYYPLILGVTSQLKKITTHCLYSVQAASGQINEHEID